jgi:hypothetical protein
LTSKIHSFFNLKNKITEKFESSLLLSSYTRIICIALYLSRSCAQSLLSDWLWAPLLLYMETHPFYSPYCTPPHAVPVTLEYIVLVAARAARPGSSGGGGGPLSEAAAPRPRRRRQRLCVCAQDRVAWLRAMDMVGWPSPSSPLTILLPHCALLATAVWHLQQISFRPYKHRGASLPYSPMQGQPHCAPHLPLARRLSAGSRPSTGTSSAPTIPFTSH